MRNIKWLALLCLLLAAGIISNQNHTDWKKNLEEHVQVTAPFQPQYTPNENPQSSIDLTAKLCGITQFQKRYGTSGAGQCIALIDSGVDLGHSVMGNSRSGVCKVPVYRDYTSEGRLETTAVKQQGETVISGGTVYQIQGIENDMEQYRLAFLNLEEIQPRVLTAEKTQLAILVTGNNSSRYNCVYLDRNQNCSFADEQPLYGYAEKQQHLTLNGAGSSLNVALTGIQSDGSEIQLTADTLGHGTFLAGLMAGNDSSYRGLAPEAQLYVYKIFDRDGQSSQQKLAEAIRQAVLDGADCINLSLSIPKEEPISDDLEEAIYQAKAANVPVIAAAGNYGPGKNTAAYPARAEYVTGVGSYGSPEQYAQDQGLYLPEPFIADYSGRGKLSGGDGPLLVAPSGIISCVPEWYAADYMYDYGTSISAAVTTAAVCHVQEAAGNRKLLLSVEQIQNLLSRWADDMGFPAAEQGYGALCLGRLPHSGEVIAPAEGTQTETIIYNSDDWLTWQFSVPQGQSRSWYVEVPAGCREISAVLQVEQQMDGQNAAHPVAMGRCRVMLYSPDGLLMDESLYLGASYSDTFITSDVVSAMFPQSGIWEVVITSADNLSRYNHLESSGVLKVEMK